MIERNEYFNEYADAYYFAKGIEGADIDTFETPGGRTRYIVFWCEEVEVDEE